MAILKNKAFANKALATAYGRIEFSNEGVAEVKDFVAKKLSELKGFTIEESTEKPVDNAVITDEEDEDKEDLEEEAVEEDKVEETSVTKEELEALTVKQLEKYAKENEIDLAGATKKADIISVILGK